MKIKRISPTVQAIQLTPEDLETLSQSFNSIINTFPTLYNYKGILTLMETIQAIKVNVKWWSFKEGRRQARGDPGFLFSGTEEPLFR